MNKDEIKKRASKMASLAAVIGAGALVYGCRSHRIECLYGAPSYIGPDEINDSTIYHVPPDIRVMYGPPSFDPIIPDEYDGSSPTID